MMSDDHPLPYRTESHTRTENDEARSNIATSKGSGGSRAIDLIICKLPEIDRDSLLRVVEMKSGGLSLPFIARYRSSEIKGISETQLREVNMQYEMMVELVEQKERAVAQFTQILDSEMLEVVHAEVSNCVTVDEVEMVVAKYVSAEESVEVRQVRSAFENLDALALARHVKGCCHDDCLAPSTARSDIHDAQLIIAFWVFSDADALSIARTVIRRSCRDIRDFKPHQWLALRRQKSVIEPAYFQIEASVISEMILALFAALVSTEGPVKRLSTSFQIPKDSCVDLFVRGIIASIAKFIIPCLRKEMLEYCNSRADQAALENFARNLRHKLLQPGIQIPANAVVFGIDPGIASGSKCVAYDPTSNAVMDKFIFKKSEEFSQYFRKFNPSLIVVGDGTGSIQVGQIIASICPETDVCIVSETGASRYSISELGMREFPSLPVEFRGCVSLVRRALDPLAELSKIEPQHLSVGMYQHDLSKQLLGRYLKEVVRGCVAVVGVDLNTASADILALIPGLNYQKAVGIISYRESSSSGRFLNRFELRNVLEIDQNAWINAAGFVRVLNSNLSPLDATAIHPEQYVVANEIVRRHSEFHSFYSPLILRPEFEITSEQESEILRLLRLSDPREMEPPLIVKPAKYWLLERPSESLVGMKFYGTVRTVTSFGAFISLQGLGVSGSDGLLHVSKYPIGMEDPQYFSANQEVLVMVESVSPKISLTCRF